MSKLFYGLIIAVFSSGLSASEQAAGATTKHLMCIFDRQVVEGLPFGSFYATMGCFEACTLTFAKAYSEKMPIIVSAHIVKNLFDMTESRFGLQGKKIQINEQLTKISENTKKSAAKDSEIDLACRFCDSNYRQYSASLDAFKSVCKFKTALINESYVYCTKNPNLQLLLILPRFPGSTSDDTLRFAGFDEAEFEYITIDKVQGFFATLYDTPDKVASIATPLDMTAFGKLFIVDSSMQRTIFLNGHGNNGIIAQLKTEQFKKFVGILDSVGCKCLSVFSCHAGSSYNFAAYQNEQHFPIIIFSVGNTVALSTISFSDKAGHKSSIFVGFFNKLDDYLRQPNPQDPAVMDSLFKAVELIHENDSHNYPWFCFPNQKPIHLSTLMDSAKKQVGAKSATPTLEDKVVVVDRKESPVGVSSSSSPTVINEETGIITSDINSAAIVSNTPLLFDNKKSLLLHTQYISAPVKFVVTAPLMHSMINVSFHYFEHLDLGRIFLNRFLAACVELGKTMIVKSLGCLNYQDSNIAPNVSGQLLSLEHFIAVPGPKTMYGSSPLKVIFRLSNGARHKLEVFVDTRAISSIMRVDELQQRLEDEHVSCVRSLLAQTQDIAVRKSLENMIFKRSASTSTGEEPSPKNKCIVQEEVL